MKLSRLLILGFGFFASTVSAIELLSSAERDALVAIERDFGIDRLLIDANNQLSMLKQREHELADISRELELKQARYNELIEALPAAIVEKNDLSKIYKQLETLVQESEELKRKREWESDAIAKGRAGIEAEYAAIEKLRTRKNAALLELKAQVTKRIVDGLSKSSSVHAKDKKGTMKCSKNKPMNACLEDARGLIVDAAILGDPFLNDKSVLLSYELIDASMNMDGDLRYQARLSFKPSYSNEVDQLLNERLGLKSARVTLSSNVPAVWHIDGVQVGSGREISRSVSLGRHGIVASYGSKQQSTVEDIQKNRTLRYTFKGKNRSSKRRVVSNNKKKKPKAAAARATSPVRQSAPTVTKRTRARPASSESESLLTSSDTLRQTVSDERRSREKWLERVERAK